MGNWIFSGVAAFRMWPNNAALKIFAIQDELILIPMHFLSWRDLSSPQRLWSASSPPYSPASLSQTSLCTVFVDYLIWKVWYNLAVCRGPLCDCQHALVPLVTRTASSVIKQSCCIVNIFNVYTFIKTHLNVPWDQTCFIWLTSVIYDSHCQYWTFTFQCDALNDLFHIILNNTKKKWINTEDREF